MNAKVEFGEWEGKRALALMAYVGLMQVNVTSALISSDISMSSEIEVWWRAALLVFKYMFTSDCKLKKCFGLLLK